jgi:chromosome segregation ATPase
MSKSLTKGIEWFQRHIDELTARRNDLRQQAEIATREADSLDDEITGLEEMLAVQKSKLPTDEA